MQNFELRLAIVILKLVMTMNILDIWIIITQIIQNFAEFRPLKAELLLGQSSPSGAHVGWSVRNVCVCGLSGKKNNDHFLLFVLTSVATNHKIITELDVLIKTAGALKYSLGKIGAGAVERW